MQTRSVADKASLSDLRRSLRHDLSAAGVADPVAFDCLVAVSEVWTRSASEGADEPDASVTWDITPTEARFYIRAVCARDVCKASHPSRAALRAPGPALDEPSMALVAGLMDDLDVTDGPAGRTFRLTKVL